MKSLESSIIKFSLFFCLIASQYINADVTAFGQLLVRSRQRTHHTPILPISQQDIQQPSLGCCAIISETALEYKKDLNFRCAKIKECTIPTSFEHCVSQTENCFCTTRDKSHMSRRVRCCYDSPYYAAGLCYGVYVIKLKLEQIS